MSLSKVLWAFDDPKGIEFALIQDIFSFKESFPFISQEDPNLIMPNS